MSRRHPLHTDIVERTLQVDLYENPHFTTKPVELGKYKITLEKL